MEQNVGPLLNTALCLTASSARRMRSPSTRRRISSTRTTDAATSSRATRPGGPEAGGRPPLRPTPIQCRSRSSTVSTVFIIRSRGCSGTSYPGAGSRHCSTATFSSTLTRSTRAARTCSASRQAISHSCSACGGTTTTRTDRIASSWISGRGASYAVYNWELFFHIPLYIATLLGQNQQFEDAISWFHYIFDPTLQNTDPVPQRFWMPKPLNTMTSAAVIAQRINNLLVAVNQGDPIGGRAGTTLAARSVQPVPARRPAARGLHEAHGDVVSRLR